MRILLGVQFTKSTPGCEIHFVSIQLRWAEAMRNSIGNAKFNWDTKSGFKKNSKKNSKKIQFSREN